MFDRSQVFAGDIFPGGGGSLSLVAQHFGATLKLRFTVLLNLTLCQRDGTLLLDSAHTNTDVEELEVAVLLQSVQVWLAIRRCVRGWVGSRLRPRHLPGSLEAASLNYGRVVSAPGEWGPGRLAFGRRPCSLHVRGLRTICRGD